MPLPGAGRGVPAFSAVDDLVSGATTSDALSVTTGSSAITDAGLDKNNKVDAIKVARFIEFTIMFELQDPQSDWRS